MNAKDEPRRSPEYYLKLAEEKKRGKLKIYLGYAVGVGKTYSMLIEGHRLRESGVDVVIGYLEPHKRLEVIMMAEGLDVVPPLNMPYKGMILKELDVDAIIKRRPKVVLVDEIAHTNASGCKNQKRYQDAEDLLQAGIDVIATLNIQHLESLGDIVKQAADLEVTEKIPDAVVSSANMIVSVDIESEELINRLKAGKIYPADMIETALNNLFNAHKLNQLREILFNEMAIILDNRQRGENAAFPPPANFDKAVVALIGGGENTDELINEAYRLSARLGSEWYMITEKNPSFPGFQEKAKRLGAKTTMLEGKDVLSALIKFVKENGVTHLIIGRMPTGGIKNIFRKSYIETILENLPDIKITVI